MRTLVPRFITALAGLWLMVMPAVFDYTGTAPSASDRIIGPFIICFSVVSMWEATRAVRLANLPFAIWAILAPLVLQGYPVSGMLGSIGAGLVVIILSFVGASVNQRFGGGWRSLWRRTPEDQLLTKSDPSP